MKSLLFISLFKISGLFSPAPLPQQESDTVVLKYKDVVEAVINDNYDVLKAQLDEEKLIRQKQGVQSNWYPQVVAKAQMMDNFQLPQQLIPGEIFGQQGQIAAQFGVRYSLKAGAEVSQLLFNKSLIENVQKLEQAKRIQALSTEKVKEETLYTVLQLYIQIKVTENQITVLKGNIKQIEDLLVISNSQLDNGIIKEVDRNKMVVNKTNLETQLLNYKLSLDKVKTILKYYLTIPQGTPIRLEDNISDIDLLEEQEGFESSENLDYQLLQQQKSLQLQEKKVINAEYFPTIAAFGQLYYNGQNNNFNFKENEYFEFNSGVWGVNIDIPIFSGLKNHRKNQENKIALEQIELDIKNVENAIQMNYINAKSNIKLQKDIVQTQEDNMDLAQSIFNTTNLSYQEGLTSYTDVIQAEQSLRDAQIQHLNAVMQLKLAELELLKTTGNLIQ